MKYIKEYRNRDLVLKLAESIRSISTQPVRLMEVCGGHTMAVHKFGIPRLLPETVTLLSGPGCPVCVTGRQYVDKAIAFGRLPGVIIATFGDLIRVPGSTSTLEKEKGRGADIRIVFSVMDALNIARQNNDKRIVFLGIGFETTAPGTAAGILEAAEQEMKNFFVYSAHKVMPPALEALIHEGIPINGYIAPGHVSTITGSAIYDGIPKKYGIGCVVSGFEPVDLLQSVYMLVKQVENNAPAVEIQYRRAVKPEGNRKAQEIMNRVFEPGNDWWRGLGILPNSGLKIRDTYCAFNAEAQIPVQVEETREEKGCICGEILKGLKTPADCGLFVKFCSPADPIGACMVSNEGACHAYYKYTEH